MLRVKYICFLIVMALGACHFEPLYGRKGALIDIQGSLTQVKIHNIPNREGQILKNKLLDIMNSAGEPVSPKWDLFVNLQLEKTGSLIQRDGTFERFNINAVAQITLIERETQKTIFTDSIKNTTSYAIGNSTAEFGYSATVAAQDARHQALKLLADDIHIILASYFKKWGNSNAPSVHFATY